MKAALFIAILFVLDFTLQTSFFPALFMGAGHLTGLGFLHGQTLNLALSTLIYLGLTRDLSGAVIWAIAAGILARWFGLGWNGAQATGFFVITLLCSFLRRHVLVRDAPAVALFAGVAFFVEGLVHLSFGQFLNQIPDPHRGMMGFLLVHAVLNALAAPVVFAALRWLDSWTGALETRSRRSLLDGL